jgi:hypothetical protein
MVMDFGWYQSGAKENGPGWVHGIEIAMGNDARITVRYQKLIKGPDPE